jgi:spore coat protein U-like protein
MLPRTRLATLLAAAALVAWPAVAAPPGADSCSVESKDVNFGLYDPTSTAPNDTSGAVVLLCGCQGNGCGAIHYRLEIQLDQGGGQGGTLTRSGGAGTLRYDLFADPARTVRLGQGSDALSGIYQPSLFGTPQTIPVYGRMPALQKAGPGVYVGLPVLTVTY